MYKLLNNPFLFHPKAAAGEAVAEDETETEAADGGQEDQPELLTFTQDEFEAKLKKQFAKGARAAKREMEAQKQEDTTATDAEKNAATMLEKAKKLMLKATVQGAAVGMGIDPKGADVAVAMADFSTCYDGDDIDLDAVNEVLGEFIKEYPMFLTAKEEEKKPPQYAAGTGTGAVVKPDKLSLRETTQNLNKYRITK